MSTDLSTMVPAFKRAVAVPGTFAQQFPSTTDTELAGVLADSVAECHMDGLLSGNELDVATNVVTPALTTGQQALVLLYGWVRMLTSELLSRKTHVRYEASSAVFEEDQGVRLLTEILKEMTDRKKTVLEEAKHVGASGAFVMVDQSWVASNADYDSSMVADIGFNLSVLAAMR